MEWASDRLSAKKNNGDYHKDNRMDKYRFGLFIYISARHMSYIRVYIRNSFTRKTIAPILTNGMLALAGAAAILSVALSFLQFAYLL